MIFTLTLHGPLASELSYLLHKHPKKCQTFALSFGKAHVFYPEYGVERATAALVLEIDTISLVRDYKGHEIFGLGQYVNDRPYVASSLFSVALAQVFGSALAGRSKDRPTLTQQIMSWEAKVSVVKCQVGEVFIRKLFEPLGYEVDIQSYFLEQIHPEWGASPYFTVTIRGKTILSLLLNHLYILMPVLDHEKHYFIGTDEREKIIRKGTGWLASHPEKEIIVRRYLKYDRNLAKQALVELAEEKPTSQKENEEQDNKQDKKKEQKLHLQEMRMETIFSVLKKNGVTRILDLGCGEGDLLRLLLTEKSFAKIIGVDISHRVLEIASERLHLERLPNKKRERIQLLQSSLTYRDKRLLGYDAAAVVEVIEHLEPHRLSTFSTILFGYTKPKLVIVTTPNAEYNVKFENLKEGIFRHSDHRFEWTRAEFQDWALEIQKKFHYQVQFFPIGPEDETVGAPTQMAVFCL